MRSRSGARSHGDGFERDAEFDNAPVAGLGSAGLGDLLDDATPRSTFVLSASILLTRAKRTVSAGRAGYDRVDQIGLISAFSARRRLPSNN